MAEKKEKKPRPKKKKETGVKEIQRELANVPFDVMEKEISEIREERLTPKQYRFIEEYLVDLNGTQAAIRAGYSENGAGQTATLLLTNSKIATRIEQRQREISSAAELTQEWVVEKLKQVVARSMQEEVVLKWDYEQKAMVPTGEYVFDSKGANTALQLLGKHIGMFSDKLDINANMIVFRGEADLKD